MASRALGVGGVRLGIRSWGDEHDGPQLLLLHSLGEHSGSWNSIAEELVTTYRVFALDLRGHGDSDRTMRYSLELMRDDVLAVVDTLDLNDVCIVGHSLGGMVGYLVAVSGHAQVTRLVLEEAPPPLPPVTAREIPADPGNDYGFDWKALTDLYARRNDPDPEWWEALGQIEIPTLVVAGGPSSHVDQAAMRAMADRIPNARFVVIDAGHSIHTRKPRDFVAAVAAFLST
jgi:pimeloyl-ACP methyl ester carboxylesterase